MKQTNKQLTNKIQKVEIVKFVLLIEYRRIFHS